MFWASKTKASLELAGSIQCAEIEFEITNGFEIVSGNKAEIKIVGGLLDLVKRKLPQIALNQITSLCRTNVKC